MHLILLPISSRRTLIHCQRSTLKAFKPNWFDYGAVKVATLWARWEKKESGFQKMIVKYGNKMLDNISYEEWSLKSIPPLYSQDKRKNSILKCEIKVFYPQNLIPPDAVMNVLRNLSTSRQNLHRSRMMLSLIGIPFSALFVIIPVIPNLPFLYLLFRAWSHWRALSGSRHLEYLLNNKLITTKPLPILNEVYSLQGHYSKKTSGQSCNPERVLLDESSGKQIAKILSAPELEFELERAIKQVKNSIPGKT